MSWCDRLPAIAGALGASLMLSGCFTPMYAGGEHGLGGALQAVEVDPIPDQLGHYLRDNLLTDLNGTGSNPAPRYKLTVKPHERVQTATIDVSTRQADAATVVIDMDYTLTDLETRQIVGQGTVTSAATYDRSEQRYANIRAARDAEIRDAKTLADMITTHVASDLATRRG